MIDDAILEASQLLASLRSMRAEDAMAEAELLLFALEHEPNGHVLAFAADKLERIDTRLPKGSLAGFIRDRLRHLAGMVAVMQDDTPTPPPAA